MSKASSMPGQQAPAVQVSVRADVLTAAFSGPWVISAPSAGGAAGVDALLRALATRPAPKKLEFDCAGLTGWDSIFLSALRSTLAAAKAAGTEVAPAGLPEGVSDLLDLAAAVPERKGAARHQTSEPFLERVGDMALGMRDGFLALTEFVGDITLACVNLVRGKAVFQSSEMLHLVKQCGLDALPIVSLISLLVGLILAFVGAIQLRQFGAQIYVATIVGIAMVRVMGAIMTGIIMAGRTGAAFAAELGTMQVNEEIDALRTFGFSPTEFLVLPRMIALVLMMPLLCIYADLMGVLGGFIVGVVMLDITPMQYLTTTWKSVPLPNLWIGLTHSAVFGVLIALAGCYRGMRCGRSALAVGQATTSAVVTSIMSIIIATAIITVACEVMGF